MKPDTGRERLRLGTKIGFGVGDIYGGGAMVIVGFYYLFFLTDVIRINPALAGIAFLVSKVWDAVTDPFEGILTDRTRTRFGRRRPFFLAGIPFIFLSFFLMWFPVSFAAEAARFAWVMAAYVFFSTVISLVMTPYTALAAELTLDYHERGSLTAWRIFFSTFSSLVCAVAPLEIVKAFSTPRSGYIAMGLAFGVFFALPFVVVFLSTRERPEFQASLRSFSIREVLLGPFRVRSFRTLLLMYLCAFVAMDVVSAVVIYVLTYSLGRGDQTNYVLGTLLVAQIVVLPLYTMISRRTSKRAAFILGAAIWCVTLLFSFGLRRETPTVLLYVFGACVGLGTGGVVLMVYSIFPDIPDVDELRSGERREGSYAGLLTLLRKASSAVGIFLVSQALAIAGYRAPVEQVLDGVTKAVSQEQTPQFIAVLRFVFAFVPIILVLAAIVAALRYPLSPGTHARLKAVLVRRRAGEKGAALEAEAGELTRLLS